jgi:hypothetical protein
MREWYSKHLGLADKGGDAMLPWREHDDPQKEHVTVWNLVGSGIAVCVTKGGSRWGSTPPFSSGKRVFVAEEILHRSLDSVLRVGSEFQAAGLIEAVHGVNQSDHASAGQIVECDARRNPALEASRDSIHQTEVLKDCSVSGCAVVGNAFGLVVEFRFGPFLPVLFGATNSERTCSRRLHDRRGITHSSCDLNHRLAQRPNDGSKRAGGICRPGEPALRRTGYGGWTDKKKKGRDAPGGPSGTTVPEAYAEFGKCGVPDLRNTAFVDTELPGNVTVLPVEIEQRRNDSVLSLRKALPGASQVHSIRETAAGNHRMLECFVHVHVLTNTHTAYGGANHISLGLLVKLVKLGGGRFTRNSTTAGAGMFGRKDILR